MKLIVAILMASLVAMIVPASHAASAGASIRWSGEENLLPEDGNPRFELRPETLPTAQREKSIALQDGALTLFTEEDESVWYLFSGGTLAEDQTVSVEIETSATPSTGPAEFSLSNGEKGIFLYLWNGTHLRIKVDDGEALYFPVNTTEYHRYRIDLNGVNVKVEMDDAPLYQGTLQEALATFNFEFGDRTHGGGRMLVRTINIEGLDVAPSASAAKSASKSSATSSGKAVNGWTSAGRSEGKLQIAGAPLPPKADALLLEAQYRAAFPRQAQIFLRFETDRGEKVAVVSTGLESAAHNDFCKEQFFIPIPAGASRVSIQSAATASQTPFQMRGLRMLPVRRVTENGVSERLNSITQDTTGQSFENPGELPLLGICIPMAREFDVRQFPGELTCRVFSGGGEVARAQLNAASLPYAQDGHAVFLFQHPVQTGPQAHFTVSSGFGPPAYYGWYTFYHSLENPYPGGAYQRNNQVEAQQDITFFAFAPVEND